MDKRKKNPLTDPSSMMIVALREQGFSCRQIGKKLKISGQRVHQKMKAMIESPKVN